MELQLQALRLLFFLMSSFFLVGWAGGGIGLVGNKRSEGR